MRKWFECVCLQNYERKWKGVISLENFLIRTHLYVSGVSRNKNTNTESSKWVTKCSFWASMLRWTRLSSAAPTDNAKYLFSSLSRGNGDRMIIPAPKKMCSPIVSSPSTSFSDVLPPASFLLYPTPCVLKLCGTDCCNQRIGPHRSMIGKTSTARTGPDVTAYGLTQGFQSFCLFIIN